MNTQNKEPNIRFNQFKELWKVVKLDSISQKVKTKNINNTFENVLTNSAEFGIIPQRDFFDKSIANLKNLNGYYVVQPNDFVYNPRISNKAPVGPIKANFLNSTGVMSPLYYVFRTQNVDVFFLAKYFDTSYWHKFMKLNGDTGARSDRFAIKDSVFKKMPIPFPSLHEQSSIGSLFRTLDDLLASYKDNLASHQSLKATMLSKMFPKAGQTVPEIRLDGFEGEWEKLKLRDVVHTNPKSELPENFKYIDLESVVGTRINKIREERKTSAPSRAQRLAKKGDVFYQTVRPYQKNNYLFKLDEIDYVFSTGYAQLRPIFNRCDSDFLLILLQNNRFLSNVLDRCTGTSYPAINVNDLIEILIEIPSYEEQQAIGAYFSNLENLISAHQEKISQLETLKKKLLQDMFI